MAKTDHHASLSWWCLQMLSSHLLCMNNQQFLGAAASQEQASRSLPKSPSTTFVGMVTDPAI
ncbi:MAG: hypothetical protein RIF39_18625 [Cyclobacteriaceae bacterium]